MRELTLRESKAVSGALAQSFPTGTVTLGNVTFDLTSIGAGLAELQTGKAQVKAGNTAQGLSSILAGFNEIFSDISVSPSTTA